MSDKKSIPPSIVRNTNRQIGIPEEMKLTEAAEWLVKIDQDMNKTVAVSSRFKNTNPFEGAAATASAITEVFGFFDMQSTPSFFGPKPPAMLQVRTGPQPGDILNCPWGRMGFPGIDKDSYIETNFQVGEQSVEFIIGGQIKKKDQPKIDALIEKIGQILRSGSIYKSKALQVNFNFLWDCDKEYELSTHQPEFMDVAGLTPDDLIFNKDTHDQIHVNIFAPILNSDACRRARIPLKRGVLLASSWGMGKTLTARVTAKLANDNGWTFLLCSDTRDLPHALEMASKLQPCVVFAEDIDRLVTSRDYSTDQVLNIIDGIKGKKSEIMTVLTTNNIGAIEPALLRPGRLDAIIAVETPNPETIFRLFSAFGAGLLDLNSNFTPACTLLSRQGATPAVIREVIERSKLAAIRRLGTQEDLEGAITGDDVLVVAKQMDHHVKLLMPKPPEKSEPIQRAMLVAKGITDAAQIIGNSLAGAVTLDLSGVKPLPRPTGGDSNLDLELLETEEPTVRLPG